MIRTRWRVFAVAIVALIALAGWLLRTAPPRLGVGMKAPDFTATNLTTGKLVTLHHAYDGQVTLVNIWATYCVPCRREMPAMDSLYRDLAPRGFRIAAVSIDRVPAPVVQQFAESMHLAFDILYDSTGGIEHNYQTTGVPESFLIDKGGHIVRIAQLAAPWNSAENRALVERLLDAPAS